MPTNTYLSPLALAQNRYNLYQHGNKFTYTAPVNKFFLPYYFMYRTPLKLLKLTIPNIEPIPQRLNFPFIKQKDL